MAVDEVIVKLKGRVIFKQYIQKKRKCFGIKIYKLSDESGYTYNMGVYCTSPCGNKVWVQVTQHYNSNNLFNNTILFSQISQDTPNSCSLLNTHTYFLLSLYFKIVNMYSSQRYVV